jgi:hypothetical protein
MRFAVEVEVDKAESLSIPGATVVESHENVEEGTMVLIVETAKDIRSTAINLPGVITVEPV